MVIEKSSERSDRVNELKEHAMELREFEGPDWDGTREDLELVWNLREALSRSVEKSEPQEIQSEPAKESELQKSCELSANDAELLLAEVAAAPLETNVDQKEKVENAERSL